MILVSAGHCEIKILDSVPFTNRDILTFFNAIRFFDNSTLYRHITLQKHVLNYN